MCLLMLVLGERFAPKPPAAAPAIQALIGHRAADAAVQSYVEWNYTQCDADAGEDVLIPQKHPVRGHVQV